MAIDLVAGGAVGLSPPIGVSAVRIPAATPGASKLIEAADRVILSDPLFELALDVLHDAGDPATHAASAAEYRLAQDAALSGDSTASLHHLQRAILGHEIHATAAAQDPAFDTIRYSVLELASRLTLLARFRAEAAVSDASFMIESVDTPHPKAQLQQAQAFVEIAQVHFKLSTYAGYVEASHAAVLAQQIVEEFKTAHRPAAIKPTVRFGIKLLARGILRLWRRLPLLVILLSWFCSGIVWGFATAEIRQILFPIWAMGLLGMVVAGFLRSIMMRPSR